MSRRATFLPRVHRSCRSTYLDVTENSLSVLHTETFRILRRTRFYTRLGTHSLPPLVPGIPRWRHCRFLVLLSLDRYLAAYLVSVDSTPVFSFASAPSTPDSLMNERTTSAETTLEFAVECITKAEEAHHSPPLYLQMARLRRIRVRRAASEEGKTLMKTRKVLLASSDLHLPAPLSVLRPHYWHSSSWLGRRSAAKAGATTSKTTIANKIGVRRCVARCLVCHGLPDFEFRCTVYGRSSGGVGGSVVGEDCVTNPFPSATT